MTAGWPGWAAESVEIRAYDPAWRHLAAVVAATLSEGLAPWLDGAIEHVGSTAVPGLASKSVVDIMAPVQDLATCAGADAPLRALGWCLVPPRLDRRPWRRFYVLAGGDRRMAHLQLVERSHIRWRQTLQFREVLRHDSHAASAYEELKRSAARMHPNDREAYSLAKAAFIEQVTGPDR